METIPIWFYIYIYVHEYIYIYIYMYIGGLGFRVGMEEKMETTMIGYFGTTVRNHSYIPS